jgi:5-methylcytosine-specific restriction endonuclease McrA
MKTWNAANPRDRRAYKSTYDATHREQAAAYRAAHCEQLKAKKRAYYVTNREHILAQVKAHADANKDRILAYQVDYYRANTEKVKANVVAYWKANPEKKAVLESRRRARKAGNGGSHTVEERREKFMRFDNVCYYCGANKPLTEDHLIPLKRGGTDNIENIVPACRSCNSSKNASTVDEFYRRTNHQRVGGIGGENAGTR